MSQSSPETEQALIDNAPEPLKQLGSRLADLLNSDNWNNIHPMLLDVARLFAGHAQGPLIEALEFYANPARYSGPNRRIDGDPDKYQPEGLYYQLDVTRDGGRIARRALSSVTSTVRDGADEPQEGQS